VTDLASVGGRRPIESKDPQRRGSMVCFKMRLALPSYSSQAPFWGFWGTDGLDQSTAESFWCLWRKLVQQSGIVSGQALTLTECRKHLHADLPNAISLRVYAPWGMEPCLISEACVFFFQQSFTVMSPFCSLTAVADTWRTICKESSLTRSVRYSILLCKFARWLLGVPRRLLSNSPQSEQ
jgi:hypothetical protein